jgi:hypothetical protein
MLLLGYGERNDNRIIQKRIDRKAIQEKGRMEIEYEMDKETKKEMISPSCLEGRATALQ